MNTAQVHRFHDKVAVHLGGGETIYLAPRSAVAISNAMLQCVGDIQDHKFTESRFSTVEVDVSEGERG